METNIFIPKRINVGFQTRSSTYTGKLAYVIYWDEKGKLKKEGSWLSWKDDDIPVEDYDNEPISGFVLNKKAGGYSTGWNHRQAKVRVYDPRGFEIEVSIPNLLYILENTNSIKGKGLEGDFVYGWDGQDILLIPADSPDYKEISKLNELIHAQQKIYAKHLKIGSTYLTKKGEKYVYMGKFNDYSYRGYGKPSFFFYKINDNGEGVAINTLNSIPNQFVAIVSDECVENFADLFDKLECNSTYSPVDDSKDVLVPLTVEEVEKRFENNFWAHYYTAEGKKMELRSAGAGKISCWEDNPKYDSNDWRCREPRQFRVEFQDALSFVQTRNPMRKQKYLKNGRLYSEGY